MRDFLEEGALYQNWRSYEDVNIKSRRRGFARAVDQTTWLTESHTHASINQHIIVSNNDSCHVRRQIIIWTEADSSLSSLHWRHNDHDGVSNHQSHGCLLNRLFRRRSKKTWKLRVTGLCVGNSPGTGEFPAQMASNAENVSIWWRHHVITLQFKPLGTFLVKTENNFETSFYNVRSLDRLATHIDMVSLDGLWYLFARIHT